MTIICFYNIPATGHVNPSLPLVRALVRRGARVICFNIESFRAKMEAAGAEFRAIQLDYDFEPPQDATAPFVAMSQILGESGRILERHLAEAQALNPDLILYDSMCPWGKQIAQRLNQPAVCSCSIMYSGLENLRAWARSTSLLGAMLRSPLTIVRGAARYQKTAFDLKRRWQVDSPLAMDFFANPGEMTLLYTSRYFQMGGELFDDAYKFVGPLIEPRDDAPPFPFDWLDSAPVIFVSLGTIFNNHPDFFRTCIEAFRHSPYRVVMAVGTRIRPADLGELPDNVRTFEYVRQLDLFPRVSLFITHGGMNSVSESAWFGVPMLLAPQAGDQLFIASQTAKLNAGVQIDSRRITASELRAAAEQVMADPRYRQASGRIGESFRAAGGIPRALAELDAFMEKKRAGRG